MPSSKQHRYLTRLTVGCNPHWWAHMQRTIDGELQYVFNQRFYDHEWGSQAAALSAALAYRDDELKRAPAPGTRSTKPGHGYVRQITSEGRPAWEGWVKLDKGRHSRTRWFIDVWGTRQAKRGCEEWLENHRRQLAERAAAAAGKAKRKVKRTRKQAA